MLTVFFIIHLSLYRASKGLEPLLLMYQRQLLRLTLLLPKLHMSFQTLNPSFTWYRTYPYSQDSIYFCIALKSNSKDHMVYPLSNTKG